jgi:dihydroorotate dehydrogenase (NAD+) catalytic subunit
VIATIAAPSGTVLTLASPVVVAAGAMGDLTHVRPAWLAGVGAATTRSVALRGSAFARVEEAAAGALLAQPFPSISLERALRRTQPAWSRLPVPVIVSIAARSAADAATLANELAVLPNVAALELCLDGADGGVATGTLTRLVEATAAYGLPVGVKLAIGSDASAQARAAAQAGAAFVVYGRGWPAVFNDGSPATLSGPATFAPMHAALLDLLAAIELPVIACGGVVSAGAARRLLDAGAVAVGIGAALLRDPSAASRIAAELRGSAVP